MAKQNLWIHSELLSYDNATGLTMIMLTHIAPDKSSEIRQDRSDLIVDMTYYGGANSEVEMVAYRDFSKASFTATDGLGVII